VSILTLRVPHETARLFTCLEIPGDRVSLDESHITLIHLGDNTPIEELSKAIIASYGVTSECGPFTVSTKKVTCFPKNSETGLYPIIAKVESPELMELQAKLREALDKAGVDYSKKFPEYKPHVTLAYSEEKVKDFRIPEVEWAAHEATLWGGDHGDERLSVSLPFTLRPVRGAAALNRTMVRTAMKMTR